MSNVIPLQPTRRRPPEPTPDAGPAVLAKAISHDVGGVVRHVRGLTELLCEQLDTRLEPDEREVAELLLSSADRLYAMVAYLNDYTRADLLDVRDRQTVDLNALIETAWVQRRDAHAAPDAVLKRQDLPMVSGNAEALTMIIDAVVDNAVKFRAPDRPLALSVTTSAGPSGLELRFVDTGIGVSERERERVFQLFYRGAPDTYDGLGGGLPMARKLLEVHGGRIWLADPQTETGAELRITLPLHRVISG